MSRTQPEPCRGLMSKKWLRWRIFHLLLTETRHRSTLWSFVPPWYSQFDGYLDDQLSWWAIKVSFASAHEIKMPGGLIFKSSSLSLKAAFTDWIHTQGEIGFLLTKGETLPWNSRKSLLCSAGDKCFQQLFQVKIRLFHDFLPVKS